MANHTPNCLSLLHNMHHRFAHSAKNISDRSQEYGLPYGTLWCILHSDLHLDP